MSNVEKEVKWNAMPRGAFVRFERALAQTAVCSSPKELSITDRYLDNASGTISSQKIALRIRRQQNKFEATLKSRTALVNGWAKRREWTRPLPKARSFATALQKLQEMGRWNGVNLNHLKVRFVLRNHRKCYGVYFKKVMCEAALDRYVVTAGSKRQARREIELELKQGPEKDFADLVNRLQRACSLQRVEISKVAGAEKLINEK